MKTFGQLRAGAIKVLYNHMLTETGRFQEAYDLFTRLTHHAFAEDNTLPEALRQYAKKYAKQ